MKTQVDSVYAYEEINEIQTYLNETILKKCKNSIIIADLPFLEYFHLTLTGLEKLIDIGGALNIEDFLTQKNIYNEKYPKAIVFVSKPLEEDVLTNLERILTCNKFQFLTIITNINESYYKNGEAFLDQVKDQLLISMGNPNYTCEIEYYKFPFAFLPMINSSDSNIKYFLNPLSTCTLSIPNYDLFEFKLYDYLMKNQKVDTYPGLNTSGSQHGSQLSLKDQINQVYQFINKDTSNDIKSVAYSINQMLELLDAKDDCFTLGLLSKIISYEFGNMQSTKHRRKNANNKVSLILIDRSLDLATPALYHDETTFDKMKNILPSLNQFSNDVSIDMAEFIYENKYKGIENGNFFHSSNLTCSQLINTILLSKPKECLIEIYRKLNENLPIDKNETKKSSVKASRITIDSIKTHLKSQIKDNMNKFIDNMDFVQIISSYCITSENTKYEKLISYCKDIHFCRNLLGNLLKKDLTLKLLDRDGPSILNQLFTIFTNDLNNDKKFSVFDLIVLCVYFYSLLGEESFNGIEEEERLKKFITNQLNVIKDFKDAQEVDKLLFESILRDKKIEEFVESFFIRLKSLPNLRIGFKKYKNLYEYNDINSKTTFKPLIKQVCEDIIENQNLIDIEYQAPITEGLKDLIKTFKLGILANSNKPHPLNNEIIIIYFIGGIESYEMKLVKETFESQQQHKILIGGSNFSNHKKLFNYLTQ